MSGVSFVAPIIGGALIGASASLLLMLNGRVAGISGIVAGSFRRVASEALWRAAFVVGLIAGGAVMLWLRPGSIAQPAHGTLALSIVAGLLVGVGTQTGSGCTSGHGVCGISRVSQRSIVATLTFMATGAATVFVAKHLFGDAS